MRASRRTRALTLVEMIIVLLIGIMVLAVVVEILWFISSSFERSEDRLEPREKAHMALTTIRLALVDAWHYQVGPGGEAIRFDTPRRDGTAYLDSAKGRLLFRSPGQKQTQTLIPTGVKTFRVESLRAGFLRLTLVIDRAGVAGRKSATGPLSIVEELLIPAIGLRDGSIPWVRVLEPRRALEPSR